MSRIGKLPIIVPKDVKIAIDDANIISIKGPYGESQIQVPQQFSVNLEVGKVIIKITENSIQSRSLYGLFRTLIANDISGAAKEFEIDLQLVGVGYRCEVSKQVAILRLGYSHSIEIPIPEGVTVKVVNNTEIKISGSKKDCISQFAAKIRAYRPPEPYNGKGVLYKNEIILRKAGKSGKSGKK